MVSLFYSILLLYAVLLPGSFSQTSLVGSATVLLKQRLSALKRIASLAPRNGNCSESKYIDITEIPFGNSGNNLIEFTHGLWVAKKANATLMVPPWMIHILHPFDQSVLRSSFCYTDKHLKKADGIEIIEVTSEDSFFLFNIFSQEQYRSFIPPLDNHTLAELSEHFIIVYCALWSSPLPHLFDAGAWLIENRLDNCFRYTSAHKRSLEGGCSKIMADSAIPADISPSELPMDSPEWTKNLRVSHPLCEMSYSFVCDTMVMHHRNGSKVFLAFDGRGDASGYRRAGAVFSSEVSNSHAHKNADNKFLDMFVAMHGDLFILNPRSTFSWEIYVVRVCLGLESVPVMKNNDVFMMNPRGEAMIARKTLWVSWLSVQNASLSLTA